MTGSLKDLTLTTRIQLGLILFAVISYALVSYWYIPNNVPGDKRANTQLYTNVAFSIATTLISALVYLSAYLEEKPEPKCCSKVTKAHPSS